MSYSQREVEYVGRHFNKNEELLEFLLNNDCISQELADSWAEDLEAGEHISNLLGPEDILIPDFPELQDVDSVSGDGGMFLGYIIQTKLVSKESFDKNVEKAKQKWKAIFNEDAELEWVMQYF
jgi:hypothetical protein